MLWIANEIPKATDAIVEFAEAHRGEFAEALETAGEAIETAWKYGETAGEWLLDNRKAVIGGLEGIAAGFVAVKAATTGMKIAQFFTNPLQHFTRRNRIRSSCVISTVRCSRGCTKQDDRSGSGRSFRKHRVICKRT